MNAQTVFWLQMLALRRLRSKRKPDLAPRDLKTASAILGKPHPKVFAATGGALTREAAAAYREPALHAKLYSNFYVRKNSYKAGEDGIIRDVKLAHVQLLLDAGC